MTLPEHLQPWERFMKPDLGEAVIATLPTDKHIAATGQRLMLQALFEAGCLRRPSTAEARREQKHINESRGMEG